tara:strand:- start:1337 stop:1783 length:447 start_codon:yes stop_codon:yes gene_type:complete
MNNNNLQKRLEFYEEENNVFDKLLSIVDKSTLKSFEAKFDHNVLDIKDFLIDMITKNEDTRTNYSNLMNDRKELLNLIETRTQTNREPMSEEYQEYMNEDFYQDEIKEYGKFISCILYYYGLRVDKWDSIEQSNDAINFVLEDIRFSN